MNLEYRKNITVVASEYETAIDLYQRYVYKM